MSERDPAAAPLSPTPPPEAPARGTGSETPLPAASPARGSPDTPVDTDEAPPLVEPYTGPETAPPSFEPGTGSEATTSNRAAAPGTSTGAGNGKDVTVVEAVDPDELPVSRADVASAGRSCSAIIILVVVIVLVLCIGTFLRWIILG